MSCNSATGAKLTSSAQNGDFKSPAGVLINYDWDLAVPEIASLGFAPVDTNSAASLRCVMIAPITYEKIRGNSGSRPKAAPRFVPGPGAASAPAGTYTEVFTFSLDPTQ